MTSSKREDTLICHITMHRNAINFLYIPGHVTIWCLEVVHMADAGDVVPRKNMSELACVINVSILL